MALDTILTRIKDFNTAISGSLTAYRLPPGQIDPDNFPMLYVIPLGFTTTPADAGTYDRVYRFTLELLVMPLSQDVINAAEISQGLETTATWVSSIEAAYDAEPYLDVTGQSRLVGLQGDILLACDSSNLPLSGHDGEAYIGAQFSLSIPITIRKPRKA